MVAVRFTAPFVHQSGLERISIEEQHRCPVGRRLGKLAELKPCPFCGGESKNEGGKQFVSLYAMLNKTLTSVGHTRGEFA